MFLKAEKDYLCKSLLSLIPFALFHRRLHHQSVSPKSPDFPSLPAIPILKLHLEYLVQQVARADGDEMETLPEGFEQLYAVESVQGRMRGLAVKAEPHLAKVCLFSPFSSRT